MSGHADGPVPAGSRRVGPEATQRGHRGDPEVDWTGVVLAGGQSRRFGGVDKTRLPLGGRTLLEWSLATLTDTCDASLVVGGRSHGAPTLVTDHYPGDGPLGGILTALEVITTSHALVLAADLPFITVALVHALQDAGGRAGVDVAWLEAADGTRPLCVTVARRCRPALHALWARGARRIRDLGDLGPAAIVAVDAVTTGGALWNVNDPLTYARALEVAEHDCPAC